LPAHDELIFDLFRDLSALKKRVEKLEEVSVDVFKVAPLTISTGTPIYFKATNDAVYRCHVCGKKYKRNESQFKISCAVIHPVGSCCHYNEEELK
jgi:hypothetical protein